MLFIFRVKRHHISVMISEGMFVILLKCVTILENKKEGMDRKDVSARMIEAIIWGEVYSSIK